MSRLPFRQSTPTKQSPNAKQSATNQSPNPPRSASVGLHEGILKKAGPVYESLEKIGKLVTNLDLHFPQIVVIGDENTGKSSLIERIAMLPFFPRGAKDHGGSLCTRMPIQLCMHHLSVEELQDFCHSHNMIYNPTSGFVRLKYEAKTQNPTYSDYFNFDEVSSKVEEYMNIAVSQKNKSLTGIIGDILTIEVFSHMIPNLTLIDLPGIVGAPRPNEPENLDEQTYELVSNYLKKNHTLALAVCRATDQQRSSRALGLLSKLKKSQFSIGVLSMSDKATSLEQRELLIKRLNGSAPDSIPLQPHGYVAVKNRDSNVGLTPLLQAANEEVTWFEKNFPGLVDKGWASTDKLIDKLVDMMCDYVGKTWAYDAERKIELELKKVRDTILQLGTDPSENPTALLKDISDFFFKKFSANEKFGYAVDHVTLLTNNLQFNWNSKYTYDNCHAHRDQQITFNTLIKELVQECCSKKGFSPLVQSVCGDTSLPLKLNRFTNLENCIIQLMTARANETIQVAQQSLSIKMNVLWIRLHAEDLSLSAFLQQTKTLIKYEVVHVVFVDLWEYIPLMANDLKKVKYSTILAENCKEERQAQLLIQSNLEKALEDVRAMKK